MVYMAEGTLTFKHGLHGLSWKVGAETLTFKHGLHGLRHLNMKVGETLTFKHGLHGLRESWGNLDI